MQYVKKMVTQGGLLIVRSAKLCLVIVLGIVCLALLQNQDKVNTIDEIQLYISGKSYGDDVLIEINGDGNCNISAGNAMFKTPLYVLSDWKVEFEAFQIDKKILSRNEKQELVRLIRQIKEEGEEKIEYEELDIQYIYCKIDNKIYQAPLNGGNKNSNLKKLTYNLILFSTSEVKTIVDLKEVASKALFGYTNSFGKEILPEF